MTGYVDRRTFYPARRESSSECRRGALFGGAKSPAAPPPPPAAAAPGTLAQAATNVAAQNLVNNEQLFGGTITNQGGAQGEQTNAGAAKRSLLG